MGAACGAMLPIEPCVSNITIHLTLYICIRICAVVLHLATINTFGIVASRRSVCANNCIIYPAWQVEFVGQESCSHFVFIRKTIAGAISDLFFGSHLRFLCLLIWSLSSSIAEVAVLLLAIRYNASHDIVTNMHSTNFARKSSD